MPITPGGRWSPADSDDWDLTTDLAAMQVSNEMASATDISTAITAATPGIVSSAISGGNYRIGLNSARLAIPTAQLYEGLQYYTTDTDLMWTYMGSNVWVSAPATNIAFGNTVGTLTGSGSTTPVFFGGLTQVTFPAGRFTSPPRVVASSQGFSGNVMMGPHIEQVTATGFQFRILRLGAAPDASHSINWIAMGA